MAKKTQQKEQSALFADSTEKLPVPEVFRSEFIEKEGKEPSFSDWYSYRESYNKQNNIGEDHYEPTFKQWYTFRRPTIDQCQPFHPEWSMLGSKKEKHPLHDLKLESPENEYKRLSAEHVLGKEEA